MVVGVAGYLWVGMVCSILGEVLQWQEAAQEVLHTSLQVAVPHIVQEMVPQAAPHTGLQTAMPHSRLLPVVVPRNAQEVLPGVPHTPLQAVLDALQVLSTVT